MVFAGVNLFLICMTTFNIWKQAHTQTITDEFCIQPGSTVRLNCSTGSSSSSVDWHYLKIQTDNRVSIFIGSSQGGDGSMAIAYRASKRHQVYVHSPSGRFELVITNVEKSDEGFYICSDASNTDVIARKKLTVLDEEITHCSNDVAVRVGDEVLLAFPATKRDSIQLEHRSIGASYFLHVFRDGRIINDYYVNDGRFRFNVSHESWNLVIERVQAKDAGIYICTEDNGLGQQYRKELVVIEENAVGCSTTASDPQYISTCIANFSGNCPPRLEVKQTKDQKEGGPKFINKVINVTIEASSVTIVVLQDGLRHRTENFCAVTSNFSNFISICQYKDEYTENGSEYLKYLAFTLIIVLVPIGLFIYLRYKASRARLPSTPLVQTEDKEQFSERTKNI